MELEKIYIRQVRVDEWEKLKAKRLQALRDTPLFFSSTYEGISAKPDSFWIDMLCNDDERIFGLFDTEMLIGITGIFKSIHDPEGKTALLGMSYIDKEYRGMGLSKLLYQARLDWAREKGFEKAAVSHREGNEASKAANQKFGFQFIKAVEFEFSNGMAFDHRYELVL